MLSVVSSVCNFHLIFVVFFLTFLFYFKHNQKRVALKKTGSQRKLIMFSSRGEDVGEGEQDKALSFVWGTGMQKQLFTQQIFIEFLLRAKKEKREWAKEDRVTKTTVEQSVENFHEMIPFSSK